MISDEKNFPGKPAFRQNSPCQSNGGHIEVSYSNGNIYLQENMYGRISLILLFLPSMKLCELGESRPAEDWAIAASWILSWGDISFYLVAWSHGRTDSFLSMSLSESFILGNNFPLRGKIFRI